MTRTAKQGDWLDDEHSRAACMVDAHSGLLAAEMNLQTPQENWAPAHEDGNDCIRPAILSTGLQRDAGQHTEG